MKESELVAYCNSQRLPEQFRPKLQPYFKLFYGEEAILEDMEVEQQKMVASFVTLPDDHQNYVSEQFDFEGRTHCQMPFRVHQRNAIWQRRLDNEAALLVNSVEV